MYVAERNLQPDDLARTFESGMQSCPSRPLYGVSSIFTGSA